MLHGCAQAWEGQLQLVKFNVECEDWSSSAVKVELLLQGVMPRRLPLLVLFYKGRAISSHKGVITREELSDFLMTNLQQAKALLDNNLARTPVRAPNGANSAGYVSLVGGQDAGDKYMLKGPYCETSVS